MAVTSDSPPRWRGGAGGGVEEDERLKMKNEGIIPQRTPGIDPAPSPAPTRGGESWGRAFLSPLTSHPKICDQRLPTGVGWMKMKD